MGNRRAGTIYLAIDGERYDAKGNFSYDLGLPKRDAIVGADGVHGYTEKPKPAYIEGEITDRANLPLKKLLTADGVTTTLVLGNGKTIVLKNSWYAGDGKGQTEEANISFRMEAASGEEV